MGDVGVGKKRHLLLSRAHKEEAGSVEELQKLALSSARA